MIRKFYYTLLALLVLLPLIAEAQEDTGISSELQVYKVTAGQNGNETAVEVSEIKPGDTLEYRLTYTNSTDGSISNLVPVLPIPTGMQYIADTATPVVRKASIQNIGSNFKILPLTRTVTDERGNQVEQEIPAHEYRRLQWMISSLQAGESVSLKARVVVNNTD